MRTSNEPAVVSCILKEYPSEVHISANSPLIGGCSLNMYPVAIALNPEVFVPATCIHPVVEISRCIAELFPCVWLKSIPWLRHNSSYYLRVGSRQPFGTRTAWAS